MHNERLQEYVERCAVCDDMFEEVPEMMSGFVPSAQVPHRARDPSPLRAQLAREARAHHF